MQKQPLAGVFPTKTPTIGISVASIRRSRRSRQTVIHQFFRDLARQKQQEATSGYALHPSDIWDIILSEELRLEVDWRSRICTWWHRIQLMQLFLCESSKCQEMLHVVLPRGSHRQGHHLMVVSTSRPSLSGGHKVSRLQHESTRPNTFGLKILGILQHVSASAIWS